MKKKIIILILLVLVLIPVKVYAATGSINITCNPSKVKAGNTTTCIVTGSVDTDITAIEATLVPSDNLSVTGFNPNDIWEGNDISDGKIDIYPKFDASVQGDFTIGELTVRVANNIYQKSETIKLENVIFYHEGINYTEVDYTIDTINVPNNESRLDSLSITGLTLDKKFNSDVTEYSASTSNETIDISAMPKDNNISSIQGIGPITLSNGVNELLIVVTAEDGSTKTTYKITVNADLPNTPSDPPEDPGNAVEPDKPSGENHNKENDEISNNGKTGDSFIIIIGSLLIVSGAVTYFFIRRSKQSKI